MDEGAHATACMHTLLQPFNTHPVQTGWRDDSAAKAKAAQEDAAARQRAHAEELAAKQRAASDELAAKQRAWDTELRAKEKAWEEERNTRIRAHEEELGECTSTVAYAYGVRAAELQSCAGEQGVLELSLMPPQPFLLLPPPIAV
mgnify:CR=1 FL=1